MSTPAQALVQQVARLTAKGAPFPMVRDALVAAIKAAGSGEGWAEDDAALPRIEARAIRELLREWRVLRGLVFDVLGLDKTVKAAVGAPFKFDPALLAELLLLGERYARGAGASDGPLVRAAWAAFLRGIANAASDRDVEQLIEQALALQRQAIEARGLELVRSAVGRAFRTRIVSELLSGQYDGMNPLLVARRLRARFDAGDYDWERLARSETAMAQSDGKLEQYRAAGVTVVDYVTANDSKVSKICRRLEAEGPYAIDRVPVPVRDSHPNCRCTILARE